MRYRVFLFLFGMILISRKGLSQLESQKDSTIDLRFLSIVSQNSADLHKKLDKKTKQVTQRWQKHEKRLRQKLYKVDSSLASTVFPNNINSIQSVMKNRGTALSNVQYIPKIDSLVTALNFLEQHPVWIEKGVAINEQLMDAFEKVKGLKDELNKSASLQRFLKERKQFLKEQLGKLGFAKELKKLNKEVYYYTQQINEYKELLKDSKKAERKALELLSKTKLFKDFMRKNSQLAAFFRLPGNSEDPSLQTSLAGLQTREQIDNIIQQRLMAGGPGAREQFHQNLQTAQAQLNELKNKIAQYRGQSGEVDIPDFKPNNQRTKSFLQRLELGTNIQTQKGTSFFPVTSDIGLSVGYKLNDKSIVGIGSSFKMGWGTGLRDIRFSAQGIGLRSFIDFRIKGSFWLSGGYEMNYRNEIREYFQLQKYSAWQESGLLGFSKVVSLKTKLFKKTKVQLLWDFLSYQQVPRGQALIFRIGYHF